MGHPGIDLIRQLVGDRATSETLPSIEERRAGLEALTSVVVPPDGVTIESLVLAGRPAERTTPDTVDGPGVVLYTHGGAYVSGGLTTHRAVVGRVALVTSRPVVALDYRLGPEHPFPAAVDDAVGAYEELLATGEGPIALAGDSAGGGLALATLVALRDRGVDPAPAAAWLMSPWTDLTQSGASYDTRRGVDPMLSKEILDDAAGHYLADADASHPLASPLLADLSGLPPIRVDVGDAEVLLDDSVVLGHRVNEAGGDAQVTVWPEMIHVFPAFPADLVPESDQCLTASGAFLAHHLGRA